MYMLILDYEQFPIFALEFVKPLNAGARKPRRGKIREEERKIGTTDNQLFKIEPPTFVAMSQSDHAQSTF